MMSMYIIKEEKLVILYLMNLLGNQLSNKFIFNKKGIFCIKISFCYNYHFFVNHNYR